MYFDSKKFGIEAVANFDFLKRDGICWRWGSRGFDGMVFGSVIGPSNDFFQSGLHELSHAIDFVMTGREANIKPSGLEFALKFSEMRYIGRSLCEVGFPKTPQISLTEIRAFALQMRLMEKELGFIVDTLGSDESKLREKGLLKGIAENTKDSIYRDTVPIYKCSAEEFAHNTASLAVYPGFADDLQFIEFAVGRSGLAAYKGLHYRERDAAKQKIYATEIMKRYEAIDNPFTWKRIDAALNKVASRIRRTQQRYNFEIDQH